MSERDKTIQFIPDRLNQEPVCFKGLTSSELFKAVTFGLLFWCPVLATVTSMFFDSAVLGMGGGVIMMLLTVTVLGSWLQKYKRNLPDGLHEVRFRRWMQEKGIKNTGYCLSTQTWDIRRQNHR